MKFVLNPPSGYADSYFDIGFNLNFTKSLLAEIKILNKKTNSYLDILSVDTGVIKNDKTIICKNCGEVNGYINIFNKDKTNKELLKYPSVELVAEITIDSETFKENTFFYNESMSADSSIIPFDLIVNNDLDFSDDKDLLLAIRSDKNKHFEFVIINEKTEHKFNFEVITSSNITFINVPKEIILHELNLSNFTNNLKIYWAKYEGVNFMKFLNKRYIEIPNCSINIKNRSFIPKSQERHGPLGILDNNFVLSDRYFIHTFKDFSHFAPKSQDTIKMKRLTMFFNESLTINKIESEFLNFEPAVKKDITQTTTALKSNIKNFGVIKKKDFLSIYSENKNTKTITEKIQTTSCKPCSRK